MEACGLPPRPRRPLKAEQRHRRNPSAELARVDAPVLSSHPLEADARPPEELEEETLVDSTADDDHADEAALATEADWDTAEDSVAASRLTKLLLEVEGFETSRDSTTTDASLLIGMSSSEAAVVSAVNDPFGSRVPVITQQSTMR